MSEAVELELAETIVATMQEEFPALDAYDEDEVASFEAKVAGLIRDSIRSLTGEGEPVAIAGLMPGTSGFTMAAFEAVKVPVGTRVYTRPAAKGEGEPVACPDREAVARFSHDFVTKQSCGEWGDELISSDAKALTDAIMALLSASGGGE